MNSELLSSAMACLEAGISIIPIDHNTKRPAMNLLPLGADGKPTWKPWQTSIVDEGTVRHWFSGGLSAFAVAGGAVSGGLLILDFDVDGFYERWLTVAGNLAEGLPVQRTGGGGYQVIWRCPEPGANQKLAWAHNPREAAGRSIAVETRGEGGYAVLAPSLHPSGNRYAWIAGSPACIPTLSQEHADSLLAAARSLDEAPVTRQERDRSEQQARDSHRPRPESGNVIKAFNEKYEIGSLLTRHGYVTADSGRLIRPGGKSESVSVKDGRSCHWSSDDPLNDGRGSGGCGCHDAFDVFAHFEHGGDTSKAVKAAATLLGIKPGATKKTMSDEPFVKFPTKALPDPVRSFVVEAAQAMRCDESFLVLPLLASLASAIGNSRRIELKRTWTEPAIVWGAVIGDSGTMKSPALEIAVKPVRQRQHEAMSAYADAMLKCQPLLLKWEKEMALWRRSKTTDEPPSKPEEPVAERFWCDDVTVEALAVLLKKRWRGLLIVRDELAGWFKSFDRYAQSKGGDVAKWLEMFGGRSMVVDRKGGNPPTTFVPRAAVSVCGGIQPGTLARALGIEHRENGLLARLLMTYPPRRPKKWTEQEISPELERRVAAVFSALYGLEPETDASNEPQPKIIHLSASGKRVWIRFYDEHNSEQAELTGDLAAAWSKLEGYAARLALVVHLIRWAAGDPTLESVDYVDADSIKAGVTMSRWFGDEARRVYAVLSESEEDRDRRRLVDVIRAKGGSVTARALQQSKLVRTAEEGREALLALVDAGLGYFEERGPTPSGGRPSAVFHLTPPAASTEPTHNEHPVPTKPPIVEPDAGFVDVGAVEPEGTAWGEL